MYLHGLGVRRDASTAYMWLTLAGNAGKHVLATLHLPLDKLSAAHRQAAVWQAQHQASNSLSAGETPVPSLP
jgi:hypothetical protein